MNAAPADRPVARAPTVGGGPVAVATSDDRAWLPVPESAAAGAVRRAAAALGEEAGLSASALADLAIVSTEMATNLARHAVEGMMLLRVRRVGEAVGIELVATDRGPGMDDVVLSTRDGHSTGGTLGIGLGAIARQATELDVHSVPGVGTVLVATLWNTPPPSFGWVAGVSRPIGGETVCGDAYAAREIDGRRQVLLCDGLGHGSLAAVAAQAAVAEFSTAPALGPKPLLDRLHDRIRHTRGVVAGIAELSDGLVRFAGVGNIAATIVDSGRRRSMLSLPGIVGQQRRESREFEYPVEADALVVLHTDGLTDKWDLSSYPALARHTPVLIAATLLRDAGRRRDDAAVVVVRPQ